MKLPAFLGPATAGRVALVLAGVAISLVSIGVLGRGVDWGRSWRLAAAVGPGTWLLMASTYLLGFAPRAYRWRLMLADSGEFSPRDTLQGVVLGYTANNLLPFRLGEVVRALAFNQLTGLSRLTALASIVAERLLDGLTIVAVLFVTLWWSGRVDGDLSVLKPVFTMATVLAVGGLAGAVAAMVRPDAARRIVAGVGGERLGDVVGRFLDAGRFLRVPRRAAGAVSLSLLVWCIEGAMFATAAAALGLQSPVVLGYFTLAIVNLGILIPSAPGYVGVFQLCSVLACAVMGQPKEQGLALGVLVHLAQFLPLTAWGGWEAARLSRRIVSAESGRPVAGGREGGQR